MHAQFSFCLSGTSYGCHDESFVLNKPYRPPDFGCPCCAHTFRYGGRQWHNGAMVTEYILGLMHPTDVEYFQSQGLGGIDPVHLLMALVKNEDACVLRLVTHRTLDVTHDDCVAVYRHLDAWYAEAKEYQIPTTQCTADGLCDVATKKRSKVLNHCFPEHDNEGNLKWLLLTLDMMRAMRAGDKLVVHAIHVCFPDGCFYVGYEEQDAKFQLAVLVPPPPWVRARRAVRLYFLVYYWFGRMLASTCAPGSKRFKADQAAFAEDFA